MRTYTQPLTLALFAAFAMIGFSRPAQADTIKVLIDAHVSGCTPCTAGPDANGTSVTPINPIQVTLGPGTYDITNADPFGTGPDGSYYGAFNYGTYPTTSTWAWNFAAADDATRIEVVNGYVTATQATLSGMVNLSSTETAFWKPGRVKQVLSGTSTAGFFETFTLSQTTTLDFYIGVPNVTNTGGGVALFITNEAPEPGTTLLLFSGLAGVIVLRSLRRRLPVSAEAGR